MAAGTPSFAAGQLHVVRCLGRGAFGEVLLARVGAPDSPFLALKRCSVMALSDAGTERAVAEARLLQRLGEEHHSILRCFDHRLLPGPNPVLELLLELAPLGDLAGRIRARREEQPDAVKNGIPEREVCAFSHDVSSALAHLESLRPKVFHRDVKPANVVLFRGHDGGMPRAKLADFGVARILETTQTQGGAATVIGTPHYFSPELCRGETYDERADAWALGCVIYEMICLHRPFHQAEGNLAILVLRITEGRYDRNSLRKQVSNYDGLIVLTLADLLVANISQRSRASDALQAFSELEAQLEAAGSPAGDEAAWWHTYPAADLEEEPAPPAQEAAEEPGTEAAAATRDSGYTDSWCDAQEVLRGLEAEVREVLAPPSVSDIPAPPVEPPTLTSAPAQVDPPTIMPAFGTELTQLPGGSPHTATALPATQSTSLPAAASPQTFMPPSVPPTVSTGTALRAGFPSAPATTLQASGPHGGGEVTLDPGGVGQATAVAGRIACSATLGTADFGTSTYVNGNLFPPEIIVSEAPTGSDGVDSPPTVATELLTAGHPAQALQPGPAHPGPLEVPSRMAWGGACFHTESLDASAGLGESASTPVRDFDRPDTADPCTRRLRPARVCLRPVFEETGPMSSACDPDTVIFCFSPGGHLQGGDMFSAGPDAVPEEGEESLEEVPEGFADAASASGATAEGDETLLGASGRLSRTLSGSGPAQFTRSMNGTAALGKSWLQVSIPPAPMTEEGGIFSLTSLDADEI